MVQMTQWKIILSDVVTGMTCGTPVSRANELDSTQLVWSNSSRSTATSSNIRSTTHFLAVLTLVYQQMFVNSLSAFCQLALTAHHHLQSVRYTIWVVRWKAIKYNCRVTLPSQRQWITRMQLMEHFYWLFLGPVCTSVEVLADWTCHRIAGV